MRRRRATLARGAKCGGDAGSPVVRSELREMVARKRERLRIPGDGLTLAFAPAELFAP